MEITGNKNVDHLRVGDREIILVGTAHVSRESADLVKEIIETEKPDTVCVELCDSRYQAIRKKDQWREMDIIKVIREKKAFLLLSNLLLASFQKRIARKLDVKPGEEMITAIDSGEAIGAHIHLADRDIRVTLSRTWRIMGFPDKMKILFQMLMSVGDVGDISEADIEKMKQADMLETLLADVGESLPVLKSILIDERDQYLAQKIRTAPGRKIVAVVGAGHVPGIRAHWEEAVDLEALEKIPPKGRAAGAIKWILPLLICAIFVAGFFLGGTEAGTDMALYWLVANGVLAGAGAIIALAHPLTILSAILAAPLTSLNPMVAAGWVSGLAEAFLRKPRVMDFESLSDDILSVRGFWRNKVTRILLVVVFTNLGSSVGTFVAIPLMFKVLH
ncbi:conjugal transfer protein TraB [Desulfonema ishimotonii]|uniref:Conjugal transfer protein TraB n=1 Tax=Desulfonema ishimotonii TaxID=45657 RepID=A0A401G3X7_9BACT|nr:TraB/GumN family protein [Desulfonema ishimotonii]GBC63948.1 conjugal transfer protein TraB [Desulfonema ishimotonii]